MKYFTFRLLIFFLIKMYSVLVKCLIFSIFTLIFDFYLFFGQRTVGKGLTIAKDMMKRRYTFVTPTTEFTKKDSFQKYKI
jgi:hypothetical protein